MLAAAVLCFLWIRGCGEGIEAPPGSVSTQRTMESSPARAARVLPHVLATLALVIALGRALGWALAKIAQPPVLGEVVAGILLGPTFLGWIWPGSVERLLPLEAVPVLGVIAELGIILYMFLVGLELNAAAVGRRARAALAISHASIVAPFLLGSALALFLYPRASSDDVPFTSFALFLGAAMAVTAFPVLARILSDHGLAATELGALALTCAAVDDATAWCLVALVVGVAKADVGSAAAVALWTIGYVVAILAVARPLLARWLARYEEKEPPAGVVAATLVLMLVSALTTDAIGIHAVFGAFLFGAAIPHGGSFARTMIARLDQTTTVLLLPAFFAFAGMRTRLGLVEGWENWLACLLILLVATTGKVGGSWIAARLAGSSAREALALGVLMNTRGLMELVVLNIGLELGILSPKLFAMMVVMALVTTLATTPALRAILRPPRGGEPPNNATLARGVESRGS